MSATADAGLFAGYFEAALGEPSGQLTIPGFTHPVTGMCRLFVVVGATHYLRLHRPSPSHAHMRTLCAPDTPRQTAS